LTGRAAGMQKSAKLKDTFFTPSFPPRINRAESVVASGGRRPTSDRGQNGMMRQSENGQFPMLRSLTALHPAAFHRKCE